MNFRIKIDERELKRQLKQEITRKVQSVLPKLQQTVSDRLEQVLFQRFVSGVPTISGQDFYELGVPDINDRLQSVIRVASQSFKVTFVGGTRNVFKMNIGILKKDYSDLLNLPESVFQYTSRNGSGFLEWLKWVLVEGQGTIVQGYDFSPSSSTASRTGGGLMVIGSGWRVPEHLAGTSMDNFLMRALTNIDQDLEMVVKQVLNNLIR